MTAMGRIAETNEIVTPALPSSVAELVEQAFDGDAIPSSSSVPEVIRGRPGALTVADRLRVRAFEMYCEGAKSLIQIAKELGCSRQYLYLEAKKGDWANRKAALRANLVSEEVATRAMEVAQAELRSKVHKRIEELEQLCEKRNLKAILAWIQLSGLNGKVEFGAPRAPRIEVFNDLSDNRQVTVVTRPEENPVGED